MYMITSKDIQLLAFSFSLEKLFIHYHVKVVTQKMAAMLTWYIGEKQVSVVMLTMCTHIPTHTTTLQKICSELSTYVLREEVDIHKHDGCGR